MANPKLPRPRAPLFAGLALLLLIIVLVLRHGSADPQSAPPAKKDTPVLVSTTQAQSGNIPLWLEGVGTVSANASVMVKVRVDGQLEKVAFSEGQDVRAGQLLAQIDPRPLKAQLAQAEAQLARDQALLNNARLDLQRYTTLAQQNSVSGQTLDTARATAAQLAATVKNDQALTDYARVQLDYTSIKAPLSGRTGARLIDAGNIVHASDTSGLVLINQVDPIVTSFTLPEADFQQLNAAQQRHRPISVEARDHNSGQMLAKGTLTLVNNQIDVSSGTLLLKASYHNPQHKLWPGQYVDVRVVLESDKPSVTVPAAAIQRGPKGTYVYQVGNDGRANMQPVKVNRMQNGLAILDEGLKAGARVVVDGQYKLKPGSRVVEGKGAAK